MKLICNFSNDNFIHRYNVYWYLIIFIDFTIVLKVLEMTMMFLFLGG